MTKFSLKVGKELDSGNVTVLRRPADNHKNRRNLETLMILVGVSGHRQSRFRTVGEGDDNIRLQKIL